MTFVAVMSHLAFALGCGAVSMFLVPGVRRGAKVGYGFDLRWTYWLTLLFFITGAISHVGVAISLAFHPFVSVHYALGTGFSVVVSVIQAFAILGTLAASYVEVIVPFTRGDNADRDDEITELARHIVRASREIKAERESTNGEPNDEASLAPDGYGG